jgi:hypothetical protein
VRDDPHVVRDSSKEKYVCSKKECGLYQIVPNADQVAKYLFEATEVRSLAVRSGLDYEIIVLGQVLLV